MFQDLRYSLRSLLKRPGFTFVVVATLALGIGVNAAIFSVFNILLRPLPVREPESIVRLFFEEGARRSDQFSFPDYSYIRDRNQSFSDVIAVFEEERFLLGENRPNRDPEEILGNFVSENYFATLGGSTHLGRFFTAEENSVPGRDAVVVLSHGFWQRRFGSDAHVVGSSIKLNGKPFTVIGITHPEFIGLRHEMPVLRLFVNTFEERIAREQAIMSAASHGATALGTLALMLAVIGLYGMAWLVVQRTREIGIRMALGAQAHNVLVLVLAQGMKLVLIGLLIGIPASLAAARLLSSMLIGLTTTDALTIAVVTALLIGVTLLACYFPARRATRVDPLETLRYE
jgi:ABC-type antimicrobial peptide transport system permease subunit